ncbi:MAG: VirB3 family type IV secretion system protein [Gammaproteobacteria bacterium]
MRGTPAIYFKALNRHFNVLGVDRQLFFMFVGLCLPIAFAGRLAPNIDLIAGILFFVLYSVGVIITRLDNQWLAVYRRHIHYRRYYAAQAGIHAPVRLVKPSVPVYQGKGGLV